MVYKEAPDLGLWAAERSVRAYYQREILQESKLLDFCRCESKNNPNMNRIYLRLQRMQLSHMAVEAVLRSLTEAKKKFIFYRYGAQETYTKISLRLYTSAKVLNQWNKEILSAVEAMLFYTLKECDIYERVKIINLIHLIDLRIEALCDSTVPINKGLLAVLSKRRQRYRKLLTIIDDYLRSSRESTYHATVAAKILHPFEGTTDIARHLGRSCGHVSRSLHRFERNVKSYLM